MDTSWKCQSCTYSNKSGSRCSMCGLKNESDWDCNVCTFKNKSIKKSCEICGAKNPRTKTKKTKQQQIEGGDTLRIGSAIEAYSNSKQKWIDGTIIKMKGKLVCVAYGPNSDHKWLEATSSDLRSKIQQVRKATIGLPSLNPSVTSESKLNSENNAIESRFKKSAAFKQKKRVDVKLRIGSPVEVYSISMGRWIDGEIRTIKKDLIKVAYDPTFNSSKWVRVNSKQFRPKLAMVNAAIQRQNPISTEQNTLKPAMNAMTKHYSIDSNSDAGSDEECKVSAHMSEINEEPPSPPPEEQLYVTHTMRREQYQFSDVEDVQMKKPQKRGNLKIRLHGAMQLRSDGNFGSITVGNHTVATKKVSSDPDPVWKEKILFKNFEPQIGKTGIVSIGHKSIISEKIIGTAEFELPTAFNVRENMTIDISDKKNRLSGIVVLECIIENGK